MENGAPYEGHFAKKQGRSPPLWARTGFVLAVCAPLAIAPVPAAAGSITRRRTLPGALGSDRGWDNPPYRHPTRRFTPPPEHSPRHPQRYVPPPVEPVRYSKPPKNEPAPPPPAKPPHVARAPAPPTNPPKVARAPAPPPPRPNSGVPPKDEHRYVPDEVLFELLRVSRRKRSIR
jgi:hypothetical protein